jgi:hypothetical protein
MHFRPPFPSREKGDGAIAVAPTATITATVAFDAMAAVMDITVPALPAPSQPWPPPRKRRKKMNAFKVVTTI